MLRPLPRGEKLSSFLGDAWDATLRPLALDLRSARKPCTVFRKGLPSLPRGVRLPALRYAVAKSGMMQWQCQPSGKL